MTFVRSVDYSLIQSLLSNPCCYRRMVNDAAPHVEQFRVKPKEGIEYVLAYEHGKPIGVFLLVDLWPSEAEVHFCVSREAWGKGESVTRAFLAWVWQNTSLHRLIAKVPSYNRLALRTALRVGFQRFGLDEDVGIRRSLSYDLLLLELVRGEPPY